MTSASQYASLRLAINFKGRRVMMPQPQLNRPIDPTSRSLSDSAQLLVSLCKLISWLFGKLYSSSIHCNGEDWTNVNHLYLFLPCIVLGYFSKAQNSQTDVCAQIFLIKLNSPTESIWDILYFKVAKTQWKGPNARSGSVIHHNRQNHRLNKWFCQPLQLGVQKLVKEGGRSPAPSTPVGWHQCRWKPGCASGSCEGKN